MKLGLVWFGSNYVFFFFAFKASSLHSFWVNNPKFVTFISTSTIFLNLFMELILSFTYCIIIISTIYSFLFILSLHYSSRSFFFFFFYDPMFMRGFFFSFFFLSYVYEGVYKQSHMREI